MQELLSGNWISFKDGSGTHYGTISRNRWLVSLMAVTLIIACKENVENFARHQR